MEREQIIIPVKVDENLLVHITTTLEGMDYIRRALLRMNAGREHSNNYARKTLGEPVNTKAKKPAYVLATPSESDVSEV
jgi:hypothetical protein